MANFFFFSFQFSNIPYLVVTPDRALFFPSVETMRTQLTSKFDLEPVKEDLEAPPNAESFKQPLPIVLDFSKVCEMDFTAAKVSKFLNMY